MLTNFNSLAPQVGEWSRYNFGDQESEAIRVTFFVDGSHVSGVACLDAIAPLLGIGEEIGELALALLSNDQKEVVDALADITIYLADFCCREKLLPLEIKQHNYGDDHPDWQTFPDWQTLMMKLTASAGAMYHNCLKRHQGIRGMDSAKVYLEHQKTAVTAFAETLNALADGCGYNLEDVFANTWQHVSKRDWKKNKITG